MFHFGWEMLTWQKIIVKYIRSGSLLMSLYRCYFYIVAGGGNKAQKRGNSLEVYKKQKFGRGGGEINSIFDILGKINSICPLNKS